MSRKKLVYCDVCRKKVMPIDDRDFAEGKHHVFVCKPHVCEPPEAEPRADIELVVRAQKEDESVDLCLQCMEDMLREVLSDESRYDKHGVG